MYNWWQLGEIECVPNSKSAEGGVKLVMHMAVQSSTKYRELAYSRLRNIGNSRRAVAHLPPHQNDTPTITLPI